MNAQIKSGFQAIANLAESATLLHKDGLITRLVITTWDETNQKSVVEETDFATKAHRTWFVGIGGRRACRNRAERRHYDAVMEAHGRGERVLYMKSLNDNTETLASLVKSGTIRTSPKRHTRAELVEQVAA